MRELRQPGAVYSLFILALFAYASCAYSQTSDAVPKSGISYNLKVPVDEVSLTFHATDAHGPINDLKVEELSVLDNGIPPRRILDFESSQDVPVRAGILIDTSQSMNENLVAEKAISIEYAQRLFRRQIDRAFVMAFGYISQTTQTWTSDPAALTAGIRNVVTGRESPLGGTSIFNSIYRACTSDFGKIDHGASGNFILLFSDGEDNAGLTSLKDAIKACQRTNTAIYAFRAESKFSFSTGPRILADLAAQTGGRVFYDDDSEAKIFDNLRTIDMDLRNQYRILYKPAELKHDGSFHRIQLQIPERMGTIIARSGYYAPEH